MNLIGQLYDPISTNFRRYLLPEQFTEQFGPTLQDYEAVKAFAQSNRLAVECTFSNRALVGVSGRVVDIEAAFCRGDRGSIDNVYGLPSAVSAVFGAGAARRRRQ